MEGREKIELEFILRSSPNVLWSQISSPSGLSEWFADNVNFKNDLVTFEWEGTEEHARLIGKRDKEYMRYRWLYDEEEGDNAYFEMRIKIDSLTNEVALIITDFPEEDDQEETILLWEKQIDALKRKLGS